MDYFHIFGEGQRYLNRRNWAGAGKCHLAFQPWRGPPWKSGMRSSSEREIGPQRALVWGSGGEALGLRPQLFFSDVSRWCRVLLLFGDKAAAIGRWFSPSHSPCAPAGQTEVDGGEVTGQGGLSWDWNSALSKSPCMFDSLLPEQAVSCSFSRPN